MNGEVRTMFLLRILVALWLVVAMAPTRAAETLRIGLQTTGTFAWQLDVIRRHGLAENAGLDLKISQFASPDAGKLALNSGSVDLAVVDWLWVARARALGAKLLFYPYSSAVGAIMVKSDSPLRGIEDLRGHVLAIAGGPLDKSWLIVQAAATRQGIDLKRDATLAYGAPPLISQKLQQGEADASLNFWNFCASLETQRLPPYLRGTRCRSRTRTDRTGRTDRLCVFRAIRGRPPQRDRPLHRGRAKSR